MLPAYLLLVVRGASSDRHGARAAPPSRARAGGTVGMALGLLDGVRVVRGAHHIGGLHGAALPAVRDGGDRHGACRPRGLAAVGSRVDGADAADRSACAGRRRFGWGPCTATASAMRSRRCRAPSGPFLAVTRGRAFAAARWSQGVSIYLAYVAGLTLVVGVLAIAAATASSALADHIAPDLAVRQPDQWRAAGAGRAVRGLLRRLRGAPVQCCPDANPRDAVITAAGRVQGVLAGWVHQHGAWPWVVGWPWWLVGALGSAWYRRYRRARLQRANSSRHQSGINMTLEVTSK